MNNYFIISIYIIFLSGEIYYKSLRHIPPGIELFVWYGDEYGEALNITLFEHPPIYHAEGK